MAKTSRDSFKFMLRLPDDLRERLRQTTEKTGRTMTAEIIHRLESTLGSDEDGAFKVWLPPELLARVLDEASKAEVDPNLLIMDAVERAFPPPAFDDLVTELRKAIELSPSKMDGAVRRFLDAVDKGKRRRGPPRPWDK